MTLLININTNTVMIIYFFEIVPKFKKYISYLNIKYIDFHTLVITCNTKLNLMTLCNIKKTYYVPMCINAIDKYTI